MDFKATDAERLRTEIVSLRGAVASRDFALVEKDEALAEKDQALADKDAILAELAKKLRLTQAELDYLKRRLYGRSSEKMPEGPGLFDALGEPEPTPPAETAPDDEASTLSEREIAQAKKRPIGRKPLPANLPRKEIEHPLDPSELACGACGKDRVRIGEERSELVQFVPASYVVEVHVRGKYACRCGEGGVVTPPAPPRPIPGSYAGPGLLAQVIVSKFDDHLPLYRQAETVYTRWPPRGLRYPPVHALRLDRRGDAAARSDRTRRARRSLEDELRAGGRDAGASARRSEGKDEAGLLLGLPKSRTRRGLLRLPDGSLWRGTK